MYTCVMECNTENHHLFYQIDVHVFKYTCSFFKHLSLYIYERIDVCSYDEGFVHEFCYIIILDISNENSDQKQWVIKTTCTEMEL